MFCIVDDVLRAVGRPGLDRDWNWFQTLRPVPGARFPMIYLGITSVDFTAEWVARVVAKASRRCVQWQVHTIAVSAGACYRRCHAEECGGSFTVICFQVLHFQSMATDARIPCAVSDATAAVCVMPGA